MASCCRLQIITTFFCFVTYMVSCFLHEGWLLVILQWFRCSHGHHFPLKDNDLLLIGTVSYAIGSIICGYILEFWISKWIPRAMGGAICFLQYYRFLWLQFTIKM